MTVAFRNITTDPASPVETWPSEAVRAALERGDIRDWARLGAAIRRDPWGGTARQVEGILGHSHSYGVTELMTEVIARARIRAQQAEREAAAVEIRDAVDRSGLTQAEFATRIGTAASRLPTYLSGTGHTVRGTDGPHPSGRAPVEGGFIRNDEHPLRDRRPRLTGSTSVVVRLAPMVVAIERRAKDPLLPVDLVRPSNLRDGSWLSFVNTTATSSAVTPWRLWH